jgi:hypothetical protein
MFSRGGARAYSCSKGSGMAAGLCLGRQSVLSGALRSARRASVQYPPRLGLFARRFGNSANQENLGHRKKHLLPKNHWHISNSELCLLSQQETPTESRNQMTTSSEIQDRIQTLLDEAINRHDDAQKLLCERATGYELCDSNTTEIVRPEELFPDLDYPMIAYVNAICESLDSEQEEGHVKVGHRQVYAA